MAKKKPAAKAPKVVDDLVFDEQNARLHGEKNLAAIAGSVTEFGAARSIVIDAENIVRAGNSTAKAWKDRGGKIRVIESDGSELVVVKRSDLKGDRAVAYALADNRTSELSTWDTGRLREQLNALSLQGLKVELIGFDAVALQEIASKDFSGIISHSHPLTATYVPEREAPAEFQEFDENIETENTCPHCGYRWSGGK